MMRRVGFVLVLVAYALLLYTSLAAPAYAKAHPRLNAATLAEYAGAWPVALAATLSLTGIMLAIFPIRRGERWAVATSLATLLILLVTRLISDVRCLVVFDPHQHGCHTFMIAALLGIIGLLLSGMGGFRDGGASRNDSMPPPNKSPRATDWAQYR
jgi:hypothetical protein